MAKKSEQDFELECVKLAQLLGWRAHKLVGESGVPDKLFVRGTKCFYIEFKKPDGTGVVSQDQLDWANLIHESGGIHAFVETGEQFKTELRSAHRRLFPDET